MRTLTFLLSLMGFGAQALAAGDVGNDQELWIMVKTDSFFRDRDHIQLVDRVTKLVESSGLGTLDGHSSGGHQFDLSYYDVANYAKAKSVIEQYLSSNYPYVVYTISGDYQTTYENP